MFTSGIGLAAAVLIAATTGYAGLQIPYTTNANTLHLWHLDDPSGQLYATDAVATSSITLTNIGYPSPGVGPYTNTSFGNPSFAGLGTCVAGNYTSTTGKAHLLYGGTNVNVSSFRNPVTGAFTFEALVKFAINPLGTIDAEIVSGDNPGALANRGWQWRIFNGTMEWNLLAGASNDNDFKPNLPSTGADAALSNTWYHVAVTFTGSNPTNSDPTNTLTFYWTLLDANRNYADVLGTYTLSRPLDGAPSGVCEPYLGIGGSARNTTSNPGNSEGLVGSIDEVRVSQVCLKSNEMAFVTGGTLNPPTPISQPPTNVLVGFGKPLTVSALFTGTLPLSFQWQQYGTNVPGQTNITLSIPNPTFTAAGPYQLIVTNAYGRTNSVVSQVTIGSAPAELFNTGLDTNGVLSAGDEVDPHWFLVQSPDQSYLGPNAEIFENNCPVNLVCSGSAYLSPSNGVSFWIGAVGNSGGTAPTTAAGTYIFEARFLLDSAVPSTMSFNGVAWVNGSITDIRVNNKSTGIALAPGGGLYAAPFAITNQYCLPGMNTLDFVVTNGAAAVSAFRVQISGVGQALPPGLPVITNQPVSLTVRDAGVSPGTEALFSVVAVGRPPLSYQWWADGALLPGATARTLEFVNPTTGAQGTNFSVVVSNDSGSVTSQVAVLTLVDSNQPPVAANFSSVAFGAQGYTLSLSTIIQTSIDPDGDAITYQYADSISTNAVQYGTNNVNQVGAALVYSPVEGYIGDDQFSYTISDALGATGVGYVNLLALLAPVSQNIPPGVGASFGVGVTNPPPGYSFQWQLNGTSLAGATTGELAITNAQVANAGSYSLVVTDPQGGTWPSPAAILIVQAYAPYQLGIASITDSSEQSGYPAANAVDGNLSTFWVSSGTAAGQGPSPTSPEWLLVTFTQQVAIAEFLVYPRANYGPANMQMLLNSNVVYAGTMANSATPLDVKLSPPVYATNAELYITSAYDPTYPTNPRNVQVSELVFLERAQPWTFGDWELDYFSDAQLNNPAVSGIGADPDGDHVVNLLEFAVGGNPLVPDATNAVMTGVSLPGNQIAVQFQERNQLGDVTRGFVASPDFTTWTNVTPVSVTQVQNLGSTSIYQAVFPVQATPLYYRLNYTLANWQRY